MVGNRKIRLFLSSVVIIAASLLTGRAEYRFDSWTTDKGLPQNAVLSIAATPDGYLWLGTYEGAARFDGVNFTTFNNINTAQIKSNYVYALLGDSRGDLWIGTETGGVVRRTADGKFVHYSKADGLSDEIIDSLEEDANGNIWVGTRQNGVSIFRDGKFTALTVADGLPGGSVQSIEADRAGGVWIGATGGLAYFKDNKLTKYTTADGLTSNAIYSLLWSERDGLWIGTGKGLCRWRDGKIEKIASAGLFAGFRLNSIQYNADNELWIASDSDGIYRLQTDQMKPEKISSNVPEKRILRLFKDRDGSMWVTTYNHGLFRYQKEKLRHFTAQEGFTDENVWAVLEDSRSNFWAGLSNGLGLFNNGAAQIYQPQNKNQVLEIFTLSEDRAGDVWFGGSAVGKFADNQLKFLTEKDGFSGGGVFAMLHDRAGNLWLGTQANGLNRLRDGKITIYKTEQGLAHKTVNAIFEGSRGQIWIGTYDGLSRFENEEIVSWKLGEDAASNLINSFYEDSSGALWLGTSGGGLYRFKNNVFSKITSRDGLFDNLAFSIIEHDGDLWMSSNRGIYRANLQELNDFADGKRQSVNSYSYGKSDGMLTTDTNGGKPAGWKTRDGYLWFATPKGIVRVDPKIQNQSPPVVLIEKTQLDGLELPTNETMTIEPGGEKLEIKYTAISWQRPDQIKFKYRLEGLDGEWTEAGNRRTAYYPYLPPGEYNFQVIADNGEGIWNETGKSLQIKVLPPFYRTWWFIGACLGAIGLIVYGAVRVRISQLEQARRTQEEFSRRLINAHETERRRIAAELHDSIGQSLAMIKNRAVFGAQMIEDETARQQLDLITEQTAQTISEVREISYNLRPYLLDRLGLTKAVKSLVNKISETHFLDIRTEIDDIDDLFPNESEMSIYRILQESLSNIVKHSEATAVQIVIRKNQQMLTIRIEDNGKGFNQNALKHNGDASKGGFGLLGMTERIKMLNGSHRIESESGAGTKIIINIPLGEKPKEANNGRTN